MLRGRPTEKLSLPDGGGTPLLQFQTPQPLTPVPGWVPAFAVAMVGDVPNRSPARALLHLQRQGMTDLSSSFWREWAKKFTAE